MQRVCRLICLLLILLPLALPVSAKETAPAEDSITISDEILSCLDEGAVDTVFRVYSIRDGYASFVTYGDIDGVLANTSAPRLRSLYFVKNKQGETSIYSYDDTGLSKMICFSGWGSGWFAIHSKKAGPIIQKVAADIVVDNIYYLWDNNWLAVYYKTNLGDYVYIRSEQKEYLMALDPFLALNHELHDQVLKFKDSYNTLGCSSELKLSDLRVDLSPYDITSPEFDPHAPLKTNFRPGKFIAIGSFVLLVALVVCRYLVRGHRKTREKKEKLAYRF